ncbi:RND transporter [Pacificimonas flava]|uniref:RND transporter n=2 Tax=Pacificimonas TaxID=1960290 RepID=A0A219B399_9SPHN|nr:MULTISPECIES: efflux RND transporter permease subunit [Pacificimonas]MBZ6377709.1 efflux RND transporter permease subunit [Pacificimonas aurantium]OWV32613.1 RND transporter [Pacificimonas flava]
MKWLVEIALRRPLTFIVMAILIALVGSMAALRAPVDIFPAIRIPVIAVAWNYSNLPPEEMASRVVYPFERVLTTTVNDIEHIESRSLPGKGIIKIFFHSEADIRTATAQVTSVAQTVLNSMPPNAHPPLILNYDASTVPILQLALSGDGLSEQELFELGQNQIRPRLITVPGAALPGAAGGRQRRIAVDLDTQALQSKGLTPVDVSTALGEQNQISPGGFVKIGSNQFPVKLNNAPESIEELNDLPVKVVDGATIRMRDVAHVLDGSAPQENVVHVNGTRSVLLTILKSGETSTLAIVDGVKKMLPTILAGLPGELEVSPMGDQSVFVQAAVSGVVHEGVIAAVLTSLMILLFLGSWRLTAIIALSIPLAVLAAIAALAAFGHTLNVMTLGGLALAIGILVDDATVTIENINWHLEKGKPVIPAILDGAAQIATPAFVSLLCICIAFLPMFFLPGVSGYLFVPMALSVIFAMVASFVLSRTLVPTLAMYLLKPLKPGEDEHMAGAPGSKNPFVRLQRAFERRFRRVNEAYARTLRQAVAGRRAFVGGFVAFVVGTMLLIPFLGSNFFPNVDSGQILLHVRAPVGSRIEDTSALFGRVQQHIRTIIPADELASMADNIGTPMSRINTTYNNSGTIGPQDGDIMIALAEDHAPTEDYMAELRRELPRAFPTATFSFPPADIVSQTLNFGAPAPIDVEVRGRNLEESRAYALKLLRRVQHVPGLVDARIQQPAGTPQLKVDVDRARIGQYGMTERDVTTSVSSALAGTSQLSPVYFLDPDSGIQYQVVAQAPEHSVSSIADLRSLPISGGDGEVGQTLGGLASISRESTQAVVTKYNLRPTINLYAGVQGRDLGAVAADVQREIDALSDEVPLGAEVALRGQYETMQTAFRGLGFGLAGAILLIYLLIVVNFQSWRDPFIIITALPGALAGIVWMLFLTGTTLSVPALTGAIMCMGVATANSILMVSFARERLAEGVDAVEAAVEAGLVRFRPVLMTALAMIIGMLPVALGLGEGGEQNAPLGRAVVGGLMLATFATLFFVPVIFAMLHRRSKPAAAAELEPAHA